MYTVGVKNFVEIALSGTVFKINMFLYFTQNFKVATKNGGKTIFGKQLQITLCMPWGSKNFVVISVSCTISEINAFVHFM